MTMHAPKVYFIHSRSSLSMANVLPTGTTCDKLFSNISRLTTIEPAEKALTAISTRRRLRQNTHLNKVSRKSGQVQIQPEYPIQAGSVLR